VKQISQTILEFASVASALGRKVLANPVLQRTAASSSR